MHKQRAQIVVEFAFVVPVFVMIVLGIIGFGRVFYAYIDVANEARAGARIAATQSTCTDTPPAANPKLECHPKNSAGVEIPNARRVTLTRQFDTLTYFLGTDGVIPISASATMPIL
jgi:Flp pilus assembly protein TadG